MNKTVKKIVSMVVAMTFLLAMTAVPVSFAAIDATPTDTYGWRIDLYKDLNADGTGNTPITALAPNQEAYVQFVLTGMKYLNAAQATLTITNGKFIANDAVATSNAAFENFKTSTALVGTNNLAYETSMTSFGESAVNFAILNPMSAAYPLPDDGVYETTDTTNGTDVVLLTYKIQAAADVSSEKPVSVAVSSPAIQIGELKRGSHTPTAVETENQRNLANVGLPTVSGAPVLVEGDEEDNTNTMDVPKNKDPFAEGGYSFRTTYTNGDVVDLPLSLKPAAEVTDDMKGAFVDAAVADFVPTTEGQPMVVDVVVVDNTVGLKKETITDGIKFNVSDTTYKLKSKPTFEIAAGLSDFDKAYLVEVLTGVLQKDEGNGYVDMTTEEINALNITLIDKATSQAYDGTNKKENDTTEATVQIDTITLEASDALIKATAAEKTGKYQLKDVAYTVYLATLSETVPYNAALKIETLYTDGSAKDEGQTTTAYTISTNDWETFYTAAEAAEGIQVVPVTLTDENITGTQIKLDVKHSQPTGNYRVVEGQEFPINYKGTIDLSTIKFEQEVQDVPDDVETVHWVTYTPEVSDITLSDFNSTEDGTYDVAVSVAGIDADKLDPNTITVIVDVDATYTAKWFNDTVELVAGTTLEDIKSMITIEADYDGVKEMVKVDPDLLDVSVAGGEFDPNNTTTAQTLTVTYDGKPAGTLAVTLVAAENLIPVSADIEIVGVEMLGTLSGTVEANSVTFTYGLTGDGKVKLMGNVPTTDATYDLEIKVPGFAAANLTVTVAGGEADVTGDTQLIAGEVANATDNAINDADFYAVAASVGTTPADATAKYDINRDGKIDALDVAAVIANLGTELGAEVTE